MGFATLLLTVSCSQSEVVTTYEQEVVKVPVSHLSDTPVEFGVDSGAETRALTTEESLKANEDTGFGVFAYYTQGNYPLTDHSYYPNFMYNQHVYWDQETDAGDVIPLDARYWKYSPLKYWPNDYAPGDVGGGATGSGRNDKVSFFAYAPYVKCDPATGDALNPDNSLKTEGIVGFTSNTGYGYKIETVNEQEELVHVWHNDPMLHYKLGGENSEDLVWGGDDCMDQTKVTNAAKTNNKQAFTFQHMLTGIVFQVGAYFDAVSSGQIDKDTYIMIEEVKIETTVPYESWLNLRTGEWDDPQLADGYFTVTEDDMNPRIKYKPDATERYKYLSAENPNYNYDHPNEVTPGVGREAPADFDSQEYKYGDPAPSGSTITPLMKQINGKDQYAVIIPVSSNGSDGTGIPFKITCTYHVWTFDPRNPNDGITKVKNKITNSVKLKQTEKGKVYAITMWLGMRSVKLDVKQYGKSDGPADTNPEIWGDANTSWTQWTFPI